MTSYQKTLLNDCYHLAQDLRDKPLTTDEAVLTIGNLCDKLSALTADVAAQERSSELVSVLKDIGSWK